MTENRFKNNSGVWYTRALFYETSPSKDTVVYTLKEEDHEGVHPNGQPFSYPSLYRLFMETNDIEEYSFAKQHLGGWSHWKALRSATWFEPYYLAWKEELEVRARSMAVAAVLEQSTKPGRDGFMAAKYVAEKGWDKTPKNAKGRPSEVKIQQEAQNLFDRRNQTEEDYIRLVN